jgi:hypothetical protein
MINQQTYYQLEDPSVYEAQGLALDIVNEDLKNQMIRREHRNYQLLADEVKNQQIKKQALLQLSREDVIDTQERALYEDILLAPAPAPPQPAPAPAPVQREAIPVEEEEEEIEEEDDPLPASLQQYENMDEEQLNIVEEAFLQDIENMDNDQSRTLYNRAQQTIENYGDRLNDDVLDMMQRLQQVIIDKLGLEEKEEEPEEEEEEEEELFIRPRTVSEYKTYLKNLNYKYVDGLRKDELVVIYNMLKEGQSDERVKSQIEEYHYKRNPRQIRRGRGLTQVGKGIKEDLHKIMLLVGSQKAGNKSLKLQKEINKIQTKLKKQLDKMKQKDRDKLMKEVQRQQIKKMAKSQIGLGHCD